MASKKKNTKKSSTIAKRAATRALAVPMALQVQKSKVGATVQAMIDFDGATHVAAVRFDATRFTVTRLA